MGTTRGERLSRAVVGVWVVSAAWTPASAFADAWENVSMGARTTAMGGAGIAGGSDSAMPTLNPAGVARVPGSIVSLSASVYSLNVLTVPDFVADADTIGSPNGELAISQRGLESRELTAFPSGMAYFLHLGTKDRPMVLAGSLSVPRQINRRVVQNVEYLGDNVAIRSNLTAIEQETAYNLALSWGMGLGPLKLGASVLGGYTRRLESQDTSDLAVLGTARFVREQTKASRALSSFDLGAVVGAQYDVVDGFRLGLSVRTPSIHLGGRLEGAVDVTYVDEAESSVTATRLDGDGVRGFPLRVGLGAELYGERWALALDGRLYVPRTREYRVTGAVVSSSLGGQGGAAPDTERELDEVEATRLTVDVALGFEWWLDDENSLRLGAFTELSALSSAAAVLEGRETDRVRPTDLFRFPVDRFGGTVGWGSKVGPADTTAGLRAAFGSGDTLRRTPDQRFDPRASAETTGVGAYDVQVFLSAAVDLSEAAAAIGGAP